MSKLKFTSDMTPDEILDRVFGDSRSNGNAEAIQRKLDEANLKGTLGGGTFDPITEVRDYMTCLRLDLNDLITKAIKNKDRVIEGLRDGYKSAGKPFDAEKAFRQYVHSTIVGTAAGLTVIAAERSDIPWQGYKAGLEIDDLLHGMKAALKPTTTRQ